MTLTTRRIQRAGIGVDEVVFWLLTDVEDPRIEASMPAGAFHTPRSVSDRAMTPATTPHGTKSVRAFSASRSGIRSRGK